MEQQSDVSRQSDSAVETRRTIQPANTALESYTTPQQH